MSAPWLLLLLGCPGEPADSDTDAVPVSQGEAFCGDARWELSLADHEDPEFVAGEQCFVVTEVTEDYVVREPGEFSVDFVDPRQAPPEFEVDLPLFDGGGQLVGGCEWFVVDRNGGSLTMAMDQDSGVCEWQGTHEDRGLTSMTWRPTTGSFSNVFVRDLGTNVWQLRLTADVIAFRHGPAGVDDPLGRIVHGTGTIVVDGLPSDQAVDLSDWPWRPTCEVDGCYGADLEGAVQTGGSDPTACDEALQDEGADWLTSYRVGTDGDPVREGEALYDMIRLGRSCRTVGEMQPGRHLILDHDGGTATVVDQDDTSSCDLVWEGDLEAQSCP